MFYHILLNQRINELGKSEFHGDGGPISVANQKINLKLLDEFQNAAEEFGIPKTNDFNTGDNHGCGYFQFTTRIKMVLDVVLLLDI